MSINKQELRLGNWFKWVDIASMGVGYDYIRSGAAIDHYNEFKEPIPLTESILEKCGFTLHSGTEYLKVFVHPNKWHISLWITDEKVAGFEEKNVAYWGDEYLPVKYLHMLQNIFYYTTNGKELQVTI